ncbi:menaquinone biosynthetic enzyme MqnA/MqnD family protein [Halalkalibacter krulwichiae]|uniref:Chorismate dehydratase n=1 Tax=Halalkalibacter krulwichiae TaxID=199441 RepID=A0A1X9MA59_9BACI|nr:menaquinone biosynthesis protein [Halalkalibacter krulwichiae]ARK30305.1 Chorismate dehydratase [Halalkalibacter krulwichiae]
MSVVVGEISYTNILPFFYYLDREELHKRHCTFIPQVPAQLNKGMSEGVIDIGGISSFAYATNANSYSLLPNLSVTSYGAVNSIFLISKKPLMELNGSKIALTSSSATSVHLLKIILEHFHSFTIECKMMKPNLAMMLQDYDACLLIGDDAIVAKREVGHLYHFYDLGELWYKQTGYSMTFAVFAVRNETLQKHSSIVGYVYRSFLESKRKSEIDQYEQMIDDIVLTHGGERLFWNTYFQNLCNDFGEREQEGLIYYYQLLYKLGYLPSPVTSLNIWDVTRTLE